MALFRLASVRERAGAGAQASPGHPAPNSPHLTATDDAG